MLLRTRVTLIFFYNFIALIAIVAFAAQAIRRIDEFRLQNASVALQQALWREMTTPVVTQLSLTAASLAGDEDIQSVFGDGGEKKFETLITKHRLPRGGERIDLTDITGNLLFTTTEQPFPSGIISPTLARRLVKDELITSGVIYSPGGGLQIAVARPVRDINNKVVGMLVVAVRLDRLLSRMSVHLIANVKVFSRFGRTLASTFSESKEKEKENHGASAEDRFIYSNDIITNINYGDTVYQAIKIYINSLTRDGGAVLVAYRDVTDDVSKRETLIYATISFFVFLVISVLFLLFMYMRRAFRPLDGAIGILESFARGDISAEIESDVSHEEVAGIARAVTTFRAHVLELDQLRQARFAQQVRQQRLIRHQMAILVNTLGEDAQADVQAELAEILASQNEFSPLGDDLAPVTLAMRRLTERVSRQHQRMKDIVEDLREALKNKIALESLQNDLQIASQIQLSVLPRPIPPQSAFSIHGEMIPAKAVGGDFYDFFMLNDDKMALIIADVTDKGVPAAFFMAISRTLLRAVALQTDAPGEILTKVNDILSEDNRKDMFVTVFYGVIDLKSGILTYACGGHNPPVLRRRQGETGFVPLTGGLPVGMIDGLVFRDTEVQISPGDLLFLYTDGVTEAQGSEGEELGNAALLELIRSTEPDDPEIVCQEILSAVRKHAVNVPQSDDIAMIAFLLKDPAEEENIAIAREEAEIVG